MANIIVVDDECDIRNMVAVMLSNKGHDVTQTEDPCKVNDFLKNGKFDLLITDLVMPGKTGIDLILELSASRPELKIIAISGGGGITGRFDYLPIAKLIGADNVFRKPFKLAELDLAVNSLLAGS